MRLVAKELFLPTDAHGRPVVSGFVSYISQEQPFMMLCYGRYDESDSYDDYVRVTSRDNGRTWSEQTVWLRSETVGKGRMRYAEPAAFFDAETGTLITMVKKGVYPTDAADDAKEVTWNLEAHLYDTHRGEWRRQELGSLGFPEGLGISFCLPIKTSRGRILFPAIKPRVDENGIQVRHSDSWIRASDALVLIAEYQSDGSLAWRPGDLAPGDLERTSRGLTEPTICELEDGRIAMICRGDNSAFPDRPGCKWLAFSRDDGESWSEPEPLLCTAGDHLSSGSNGSALFRSIRNGKLYWIGNPAVDRPPLGNSPRSPLAIFEVQEEPLAIRRETMIVIDQRGERDTAELQLSNFRYYQDRETGEVVVFACRLDTASNVTGGSGYYRYRISL